MKTYNYHTGTPSSVVHLKVKNNDGTEATANDETDQAAVTKESQALVPVPTTEPGEADMKTTMEN